MLGPGRAAGQYCLELGARSSQNSTYSGSTGAPSTTSSVSLKDSRRSASLTPKLLFQNEVPASTPNRSIA
jgi:hypothetical protein